MKTIEEAAKEIAFHSIGNLNHFTPEQCFRYGVEFTQQWIAVKKELPKLESDGLSKVLICKSEFLTDEFSAYYDSIYKKWKLYPTAINIKVTHWRPIEFK